MSSYKSIESKEGLFTLRDAGQINAMEFCNRLFEQFEKKTLGKSRKFISYNSTPPTAGFETWVVEVAQ